MPADPRFNKLATQSLFTEHLWVEISKVQPMRWAKSDVDLFVRQFIRNLSGLVAVGYVMEFPGFGVFRVVSTNAARRGIPKKIGVSRVIPPRCKVIFCPSKKLKKAVLPLKPEYFPRGKTRAERAEKIPKRRRNADPT